MVSGRELANPPLVHVIAPPKSNCLFFLLQILNLEKPDEILEYWGGNAGTIQWRLKPNEVKKVPTIDARVCAHARIRAMDGR